MKYLVGSREGNKSIIAKGISRNMRQYRLPRDNQGNIVNPGDSTANVGYIAKLSF